MPAPRDMRRAWELGRALRPFAGAAALTLAATHGAHPAAAQPAQATTSGRFEIRVGGRATAAELYAIRPQGGGRMAVGRSTAAAPGGGSFEVGLEVDGRLRPVRYELRPGDESVPSVVATQTGARLRLVTSSAAGERMREFLSSDDLLIVERGVAHHYVFVAERALGEGGTPRRLGDALVPLDGERVPITLRAIVDDPVRSNGEERPARRLDLLFGDEARRLWVAPSGELLRVEAPARDWVAVRVPGGPGR